MFEGHLLNMKYMISVAMATYNGARFLRAQLDSILRQTIRDIELVVSDDCSSDGTWEILEEYRKNVPFMTIHRNEANLGYKKNFEKAIRMCQGDYIALSDQDDIWEPNHLETLLSVIGEKQIACGNAVLIDSKGKPLELTLSERECLDTIYTEGLEQAYKISYYRNPYQGASMLMKREFFDKALPIPEKACYHDTWFATMGCFSGGIAYTLDIITLYRMHDANVSGYIVKSKSRLKNVCSQLVFSGKTFDRRYLLEAVLERQKELTAEERKFIDDALRRIKRSDSLWGRIYNFPFRMRHYKQIYTC